MAAVDAYASLLVGACHELGSPLGALLSNVALAREDLADLAKRLRTGAAEPDLLLAVEQVHSDLGDAARLIHRLRETLVELRNTPAEASDETSTSFFDVFEPALRFAGSAAFRGARVTKAVLDEDSRDELVVKGDPSLVLRLILGTFSAAASAAGDMKERARFHIEVAHSEHRVRLRVEGRGAVWRPDLAGFQTFAKMFTHQGGALSQVVGDEEFVVSAEFARYAGQ